MTNTSALATITATHPEIGVTSPVARNRPNDALLFEFDNLNDDHRAVFTMMPSFPVVAITAVVNPERTVVYSGKWAGGVDGQKTSTTMEVYVDGDHAIKTSGFTLDHGTATAIAARVAAGAHYVGVLIDGHTVEVTTA